MTSITPGTLSFLQKLKKNNNKEWFEIHRSEYNTAKKNFEEFISALLTEMGTVDENLKELKAGDCIFRINRDIRFSKDKTPYKISRSAFMNKGGKKSVHAGYYVHVQPDGKSFFGGGLWMPNPPELKKVRQEIDYCFNEFKKIIQASSFKKQYGELEKEEKQMLVNVPRGYDPQNPAAEFLRLKSFVAT